MRINAKNVSEKNIKIQNVPDNQTRKNDLIKWVVFLSAVLLIAIFVFEKILHGPITPEYREFIREDGPVEYFTSVVYFLTAVFSALNFKSFLKTKNRKIGLLFLVLGIGFGIAGFEEISWGQRILEVETPESFSSNIQSEINLHNLQYIHQSRASIFMLIGAIGGFAWFIFPIRTHYSYNLFVRFFIPRWFLLSYFVPIFFYWFLTQITPAAYISLQTFGYYDFFHLRDQEFFEFLLSLGFLFLILTSFSKRKQQFEKKAMCELFHDKIKLKNYTKNMNWKQKIILMIMIIIIISGATNQIYQLFSEQVKQNLHFFNIVKVEKDEIFQKMRNVENYPILFPENVLSIKIVNQTDNIIVAEEKIRSGQIDFNSGPIGFYFGSLARTESSDRYSGYDYNSSKTISSGFTSEDFQMDVLVKHKIISPDTHTIEILNGEAKGTKISITYHEIDEGTKIETYVQLQSSGLFRIFLGYMNFDNFESINNSIISTFEKSLRL